MAETETPGVRRNVLVRLWKWFWGPAGKYSLGGLLIIGGIGGILFWGSFNWAMELSNSESFCVSCHEMESTVYKEVKKTVHYANHIGIRAICSDCHVPKEWIYKVARKAQATFNELPKHLLGVMDTREKFEAKRLELAKNVWATMKATDSRECRNCHDFTSMDLDKQLRPARKKHAKAIKKGQTCIDCHKGIAHELPKGYKEEN